MVGTNNVLQVNQISEREDTVIRIPQQVYAGDIPGIAKFLGGEIASFSASDKICSRTIDVLKERFGFSRSSISRNVNLLIDKGYVSRERQSQYIYSFDMSKVYIRIETCMLLYSFEFSAVPDRNIKAEVRTLKNSEALVFAWFYARGNDKKLKDGVVEASIGRISSELNLSEKTVRLAIYALRRARLIILQSTGKSKNSPSKYKLNERLYNRVKKATRKARKTTKGDACETQEDSEATRRAKYYETTRAYFINLAMRNERIAYADAEFKACDKEYRRLSFEYGMAEGLGKPNVAELKVQCEEARKKRARVLARLNLIEGDLEVRCRCTKCKDTGTDERGRRCDCYEIHSRRPQEGEKKGR